MPQDDTDLLTIFDTFPDEAAARQWFEGALWGDIRACGHCGRERTRETPCGKPMPYWCSDCRRYFSIRTGTLLACSPLPLRKWAIACYLELSSPKGIASTALARAIGVRQGTAWFMLHRLREAFPHGPRDPFAGPVEVDETYMGGLERNKHSDRKLRAGRGAVGKTIVVGARDRASGRVYARVAPAADRGTLHRFIRGCAALGAAVFTDEATAYRGMPFAHRTVIHSAGQYVDGDCHTNGIESFWAVLKRAHKGVYHNLSAKHLDRYARAFAGKNNCRGMNTLGRMEHVAAAMRGKRLTYRRLVKPNGLSSGARPIAFRHRPGHSVSWGA